MSSIAGLILTGVGKSRRAQGQLAQAILLRQLIALGAAVADAHQAVGNLRRAEQVNRALNERLRPMLQRLEASMPPAPVEPSAWSAQQAVVAAAFAHPAGSVIPPRLPTPPAPARRPDPVKRSGAGVER